MTKYILYLSVWVIVNISILWTFVEKFKDTVIEKNKHLLKKLVHNHVYVQYVYTIAQDTNWLATFGK